MKEKKSNLGIIFLIIIIILLLLFGVWFFLLRDKKEADNKDSKNETTETTNTNTDVPTSKPTVEYNYTAGVLTQIVDEEKNPLQTDFIIDGIILVGNRHSYLDLEVGAEGIMEKLVSKGYLKTGINSSFYLNEYIQFYIDTTYEGSNDDVKIIVAPHKTVEEFNKMSLTELTDYAYDNGGFAIDYTEPDEDNYKYVGEGYVNMDYPEGNYDILFIYKGKIAYFVELTLTLEEEN